MSAVPPTPGKPLVSVVLPTFNRLRYLRPAIESVFEQTFQDWELVVADDGSDEDTREYLRMLETDPRVRVLYLSHTGSPAKVRNAGLGHASGKYVAFLDSDDLWLPRKLHAQLETLRSHGGCSWCYTGFLRVDADGRVLPEEQGRRWVPCAGDIFEQLLSGEASIRTPSVLAARQLLLQAGGFDEAIRSAEDFDLWMRLALCGEVAVTDEALIHVRFHEENHSRDWSSAFAGQEYTFRKLSRVVEARRRALIGRERARNALRLAAGHSALGGRAAAIRAIAASAAFSWYYVSWWSGTLRLVLRNLLPERVLSSYRRRRGSAS
jgi:glycosyltransferase involved in cell wall biosynthesis